MLYLDIKRVMRMRGIENQYKKLLDMGFAPKTVRNFLKNDQWRINFETLEKLCLGLNCTPNDIFEWKVPADQINPDDQALSKLKRGAVGDVSKILASLPLEKIEQITGIIQDLKDE